jgi:hypothetical protein
MSLTSSITCCIEYAMSRIQKHNFSVDCIGSCKIKLPYDHNHDGPLFTISVSIVTSNSDIICNSLFSLINRNRNSCHNRHVFSALIKGEVIRYIRNTNNQDDLQHMLTQFKLNLIKRGYKENEIMRCINEALTKNRLDLINKNKTKQNKEIPLVLSSRYNP